jgi:hypothetical protein
VGGCIEYRVGEQQLWGVRHLTPVRLTASLPPAEGLPLLSGGYSSQGNPGRVWWSTADTALDVHVSLGMPPVSEVARRKSPCLGLWNPGMMD